MLTKNEARRYLNDVSQEQSFWVNNGNVLKNLEDLANALPEMGKDTFQHHVNKEKNDFSNWIGDVIGDKVLANDLRSSKSKESALNKLRSRLISLKKKSA